MSYQVLARKWRPVNFSQIVGQNHVVRTLSTALEMERIHHAYLFTGTRGVGKTTIARIMARCLNCEEGVSADPCGKCSSCIEINEGRFVDLIEVDAASKTKIEDTRELLENVQYRPSRGKYKIYLIDEVHMLSKHSFNALLKTLEEPPPHVIFLLATTDPQMLPATVLSRCLQFHLKNMTTDEIFNHLKHILTTESIAFDDKGVYSIAQSARGSMRDGLSLLDQSIAYGQGKVSADEVKEMLGTIDHDHIEQILDLLIRGDMSGILSILETMDQFAPNYTEVLDQIILALHQIALAQEVTGIQNPQFNAEVIADMANRFEPAELQMCYQIALTSKRDLYLAPSARAGLEMCLLRMNSFRPADASEVLAQGGSVDVKKSPSSSPEASKTSFQEESNEVNPSLVEAYEAAAQEVYDPEPENLLIADEPSQANVVVAMSESDNQVQEESLNQIPIPDWSADSILRPIAEKPEPIIDKVEQEAEIPNDKGHLEAVQTVPEIDDSAQTTVDDTEEQSSEIVETTEIPTYEESGHNTVTVLEHITESNWHNIIDGLEATGIIRQILLGTQIASNQGGTLTLYAESRFWDMISAEQINQISVELHKHLAFEFALKIEAQHPTFETPGQRKQRLLEEQLQSAKEHLEADPIVQGLEKKFSASLDSSSIVPINSTETT